MGTPNAGLDPALWGRVEALDLGQVRQAVERDTGWSAAEVVAGEDEYRRFLYLAAADPDVPVVPTARADCFWHAHILDTRAYERDCRQVVGRFLHHEPGDAGSPRMQELAEQTQARYVAAFGADQQVEWPTDCAGCGGLSPSQT